MYDAEYDEHTDHEAHAEDEFEPCLGCGEMWGPEHLTGPCPLQADYVMDGIADDVWFARHRRQWRIRRTSQVHRLEGWGRWTVVARRSSEYGAYCAAGPLSQWRWVISNAR